MITLNKYADRANRVWLELYGLSTDTKPIEKFENSHKKAFASYTIPVKFPGNDLYNI